MADPRILFKKKKGGGVLYKSVTDRVLELVSMHVKLCCGPYEAEDFTLKMLN